MAGLVLSTFSLFSWSGLISLIIWVSVCNGVFVALGVVVRKDIKCMTNSVRHVSLYRGTGSLALFSPCVVHYLLT